MALARERTPPADTPPQASTTDTYVARDGGHYLLTETFAAPAKGLRANILVGETYQKVNRADELAKLNAWKAIADADSARYAAQIAQLEALPPEPVE
jgi:hypothetical protein